MLACVAALILAGLGIFSWQRSQIVRLRAQVTRQGEALDDLSLRVDGDRGFTGEAPTSHRQGSARLAGTADDALAAARTDERRVILDEYRDVLAQMNLAPETASRLLDLLTDRVETVLDAQDAAIRVGFAEGSAQMARAVGMSIAQVDRDIVGLVGQDGIRRLDGYPPVQQVDSAPQAPVPVVVNVVVQAPSPPVATYAEAAPSQEAQDASAQYVSYPFPYVPFYPVASVAGEARGHRRQAEGRNPGQRLFRNISVFAAR
jgi:hypothetical protein